MWRRSFYGKPLTEALLRQMLSDLLFQQTRRQVIAYWLIKDRDTSLINYNTTKQQYTATENKGDNPNCYGLQSIFVCVWGAGVVVIRVLKKGVLPKRKKTHTDTPHTCIHTQANHRKISTCKFFAPRQVVRTVEQMNEMEDFHCTVF